MADVWQGMTSENVEVLVTMGRIEENLRHLREDSGKTSTAAIAFQQSTQESFAAQAKLIEERRNETTELRGYVKSVDNRVKVVEESMRAAFTKSTVIVGLIFTAVNVAFGIFGK